MSVGKPSAKSIASCLLLGALLLPPTATAQPSGSTTPPADTTGEQPATSTPIGDAAGDTSAKAKPTPPMDEDTAKRIRADELAERGKALGRQERWQEALPLFQEAYLLKQSYDIAGNLGLVEAALKRWRDAAEHLSLGVRGFPSGGKASHREHLANKLKQAQTHVGAVVITVNMDGARVRVDGNDVGATPLPAEIYVDPGTHTISATLAGYRAPEQTLAATAGSSHEISLTLVAAPNQSPGKDAGSTEPESALPAWPIIVGAGLSAALFGVGIGLRVVGAGQKSDAEEAESAVGGRYDADVMSMYEDADGSLNASTGLFIAGGVAAAGTIVYSVLYATADEHDDEGRQAALRPRVIASPQFTGIILRGRF